MADSYKKNSTGQMEMFVDFRPTRVSEVDPSVVRKQLWIDPKFDPPGKILGKAYDEDAKIEWKRPKEFRRNPQLFTDGRSRYDVGQGSVGTCWFLSTVSTIADKNQLLDNVIPPQTYSLGASDYDGKFHARFWQFGKWEDVYVDDRLPVIYGNTIWAACSASDENEMWISLLEKAFAKHHGSYNAVDGGQAGDAYVELTGGVAETVKHEEITNKDQFYARMQNAISSGCQVTASVPIQFDNVHGLVGGHAYTVCGIAQVREEKLLRLRNPWGKGEWTGRWNDKDPAWNEIQPSKIPHAVKDDGEFWLSYNDYMTFFDMSVICSLTPDFDEDGRTDSLDYVLNIYGQWTGSTAAGFQYKLRNPKYLFTLPDSANEGVPVVVQLIQKRKHRKDNTDQIRCDLFKIQGGTKDRLVLENMGVKTNDYNNASQRSFRFRLVAGNYCLVPSTLQHGIEREFLIRVFSSTPLVGVRETERNMKLLSYELQPSLAVKGKDYPLPFTRTEFGSWRSGVNSGGHNGHYKTHDINPQYHVDVSQTEATVMFRVLQDRNQDSLPIGLCLYSVDDGERIPLKYDQIYAKSNGAVSKVLQTTDGEYHKYVQGFDFNATYILGMGQYLLLVHTDKPEREGDFTLLIKSTSDVRIRADQNGN